MTPASVARFMASLFPTGVTPACRLLDAGAGVGALSCAFLDRCVTGDLRFKSIEVSAYEIDPVLEHSLAEMMTPYREWLNLKTEVNANDFIEEAARLYQQGEGNFTHVIMNPPYRKIGSGSAHRLCLRSVGVETVNLYSAFAALAILLSAPGGQIVAIIPRSFCNGPYYKPFRKLILERTAIRHLHLFDSRSKAFKDDEVLQENLIVRLECGARPSAVTVSTSTDDTFTDLAVHAYDFDQIVFPGDSERFIHVPTSPEHGTLDQWAGARSTLAELSIGVSTGPVVDFRMREFLRDAPAADTVPLLYPGHFTSVGTEWPKPALKKPDAIVCNSDTAKWLFSTGSYCVVRRFSAKEERRRIVASVVSPETFGDAPKLGFENHLNVFHANKKGLPKALAHGLAAYLNTTAVDNYFRRFNGHTQVNATDLKQMLYPSRAALIDIGEWVIKQDGVAQHALDEMVAALVA